MGVPEYSSPPRLDVAAQLPFKFIKSQIIPPAPSRSQCGLEPVADFLLEFSGHSWIAYGALSAVVISHFPDPSLEGQTKIGPIFSQVIDFPGGPDTRVSCVSWSPVTPSVGELAVASGDAVILLSFTEDESSRSSFCWAQTTKLVHAAGVEAIKWTGSGDGIISGGIEVVLWRRGESWEKAWSFKPDLPQALVSACWSANGLLATAPSKSELQIESSYSPPCDARKRVLVFKGSSHPKYPQAELHHPMPVTMVQFRPSGGRTLGKNFKHALRPILLTCCMDGAARLWGEIDDGKIRRTGKDDGDHKSARLSFCVIALIEVNQTLNGFLGSDVFISWATEVEGMVRDVGEDCFRSCLCHYPQDTTKICEWVIGLGPKRVVTLWAIQNLDDSAPLRFPRVALWKKLNLVSFDTEASHLLLSKVLISRDRFSDAPLFCDLVQLLSCNIFAWSSLYSHESRSLEQRSTFNCPAERTLTAGAIGVLDVAGHSGKILQVAIHPFIEVELAASLDENGTIILWSFSSFFNNRVGVPALTPFWKACGETSISEYSPKCGYLSWVPAVLDKELFLLVGTETGVECLLLSGKDDERKFVFHNLFSIPFGNRGRGKRLSRVCSLPLPTHCHGNFFSSKFLVIAIWMEDFQALSWEIIIHHNQEGNYCSEHPKTVERKIFGEAYSIAICPCSSSFPVPHNDDKIMSCDVISPCDTIFSPDQRLHSFEEFGSSCYAYHMTTGCDNGSIKLWRSIPTQSMSLSSNWVLVGMITSEHGHVVAISPSPFCQKIASASVTSKPVYSTTVSIWECLNVQSAGGFIQEEKLSFDGNVVAMKWLKLGNGQFLLGICLTNEFRIYISRRLHGLGTLKCEKPPNENSWVCISINNALPSISEFLWGPKGSLLVLHDGYLSLFSQFLMSADNDVFNESPLHMPEGQCLSKSSLNVNFKGDLQSIVNAESFVWKCDPVPRICFWSLSQIAEKVAGYLPLFHPEALLLNLYSGNWRRALIALRHLAENLACSSENERRLVSSSMLFPVSLSKYMDGQLSLSSSYKLNLSSSEQRAISFFNSAADHEVPCASLASSSSRSEFDDFRVAFEQLYDCRHIDKVEKMEAVAIIDILEEVTNHLTTSAYGSLDEFGRRFWVAVKFQKLYLAHNINQLPQTEELIVSSALITWAFHSDCHDILFNSLLAKESSWEEIRNMGVGFWYRNVAELRVKMEALARQRYIKSKDPKACALLYIALNRVQVLAGLFKISKDDKNKVLAGFLSRNFQEDKNKAAALKNAYVLMGKHQLELAVAFFLLGGDASSAVMVCAKNLGDEQLALVICRLVEGYGGPLECNLISKFLLPSALSKGDLWMASFLEWVLGNYYQSFLRVLGVEKISEVFHSKSSSFHAYFQDPIISQYCLMLSSKACMKNAIGEFNATVICRLATSMNASLLAKCGLSLEALECLRTSSSLCFPEHGVLMHDLRNSLVEEVDADVMKILTNSISDEVSAHIIWCRKLCLAMQYTAQLLRVHPSLVANFSTFENCGATELCDQEFKKSLEEFLDNLKASIAYAQNNFGLVPNDILEMVLLHYHLNGLEFIGHYILQDFVDNFPEKETRIGPANLFSSRCNLLLKAAEEFSCLFAKYVWVSCMNCSSSRYIAIDGISNEGHPSWLVSWAFSNQGIFSALQHLRSMMRLSSHSSPGFLPKFSVLDLFLYHMVFASSWLLRNFKAFLLIIRPILVAFTKGTADYEIQMKDLIELLSQIISIMTHDSQDAGLGRPIDINGQQQQKIGAPASSMIWHIAHSSLWVHVSDFLTNQVDRFSEETDTRCSSSFLPSAEHDNNAVKTLLGSVSTYLSSFLKMNCANISFFCAKLFAMYLLHTVNISERGIPFLLEDFLSHPEAAANYKMGESMKGMIYDEKIFSCELLWHIFTDPKMIHGVLLQEYRIWLPIFKQKSSTRWIDSYLNISEKFESDANWDKEDTLSTPRHAGGSPLACLTPDDHPFQSFGQKDSADSKVLPFQNPIEVHKRSGELVEALCINSIDQHRVALASNKKGIVFFNWDDGTVPAYKSQCILGEAEWPHNEWAGCESVPVPTYISPGVGLGSKRGAHLGLGGASVGAGAIRPGKDFTGGGAFGIPGYAGIGASDLGWGVQEGFEEILDPPATVDNIRTRALASHPSKPFFLVGSSNTHIYLWEFGKEKATATYGVLPAANIPPPYPLASVSALKFDHCGHRFVTGALDGTISTWQLEVGGRSNVHPTESSLCFSDHTSDVTYVTTSGSIVAAAGYSSNGVNVVVWDTLAPPATSQASIMCHEGGARSLAVFDNDIGTGSISPLILTGGEGGDVGLHDFRYIATGKTKKQKQPTDAAACEHLSSSKTGDQNRNGMLWYIPKAHSASVTKICTIPHTSLFLTGSKDGDVKLWDAQRAKLVYHWPRLHERHMFLQVSSRGFPGVVRAAVTDIQVASHGFLTCGGDGLVKFVKLQDLPF